MLHHSATEIPLGYDSIGSELVVGVDNPPTPTGRREAAGIIGEYIPAPIATLARNHDADCIAIVRAGRAGGVHRHDHPRQLRLFHDSALVEHCAGPESTGNVIQDLGFELLAPEAGAAVAVLDGREEVLGEVRGIVECAS